MARFLLAFTLVTLPFTAVQSQSLEEIEMTLSQFLSESPTSMIHNWISVMEPPEFVGNALALVASAVKTKSPEFEILTAANNSEYDCNLTGVDPSCFLGSLASVLGESWGSARSDLEKMNHMIESYLRPKSLTMPAALVACLAADKALRLLSNPGNRIPATGKAMNEIKQKCK